MINSNLRVMRALNDRGIATAPASAIDKTPLTEHGFHDRTTDARQLEEWTRRFPGCLWLIVPADLGAVAFDDDKPTTRFLMRQLGLDGTTYRTTTPGGLHVLFRNPSGLTGGFQISLEDLGITDVPVGCNKTDRLVVRIDRGYVVAPGCSRADGGRYSPCGKFSDMAPLPDAAALFLEHYHRRRPSERSEPHEPAPPIDPADSVIIAFNRWHRVEGILERNGYQRIGKRWLAPNSSTGMPGVVILEERAYSHHGCDPIADGHSHDAFSLYTVLEHRGDVRKAVKAAAEAVGMDRSRINQLIDLGVRTWTPRQRDPFVRCRFSEATL